MAFSIRIWQYIQYWIVVFARSRADRACWPSCQSAQRSEELVQLGELLSRHRLHGGDGVGEKLGGAIEFAEDEQRPLAGVLEVHGRDRRVVAFLVGPD